MRILKPGDTCPCCGMPIKTTDPDTLYVLSILNEWIERDKRRSESNDEK